MRDESERPGEQRSLDGRWPFKKMNREELFKVITWFLGSQTEKYAVEGQSEAQEETLPTKSKVNRRFFETLYLNELARRHFQADPTEETQNLLLRLARHVAFSPLKRRASRRRHCSHFSSGDRPSSAGFTSVLAVGKRQP